mgnify:CR=1 FL=1
MDGFVKYGYVFLTLGPNLGFLANKYQTWLRMVSMQLFCWVLAPAFIIFLLPEGGVVRNLASRSF